MSPGIIPYQYQSQFQIDKRVIAHLESMKKDLSEDMNKKLNDLDKKYESELSKIQNMIDTEFGLVDDEEILFEDVDSGDQRSQISGRPIRKNISMLNNQITGKNEEVEREEDKEGGTEGGSSAEPKKNEQKGATQATAGKQVDKI